jgi:hypothetical protein
VAAYGLGAKNVYLGSGEVSVTLFQESNGARIFSNSALNWNAANSIDGGLNGYNTIALNSGFSKSPSEKFRFMTRCLQRAA